MSSAKYTVKIENQNLEFACKEGESIVDSLSRVDARHPMVGCKGGGCGICKSKVISGDYTTGNMSVVRCSHEEREQGYVLACKTYPSSDMVIDYVGLGGK